jgi:hypothetical protein
MSQTAATASPIVAPATRDLHILASKLTGWLGERLSGADDIRITNLSYPLGAGMSHETILFDAAWTEGSEACQRGMVVRIKPTNALVYHDDRISRKSRARTIPTCRFSSLACTPAGSTICACPTRRRA